MLSRTAFPESLIRLFIYPYSFTIVIYFLAEADKRLILLS